MNKWVVFTEQVGEHDGRTYTVQSRVNPDGSTEYQLLVNKLLMKQTKDVASLLSEIEALIAP